MKRFLTLAVILVAIELLTPSVDVGAYSMIAPAVIAAIIGGVATLLGSAMGGKPKGEGHQAQPSAFGDSSMGGGAGSAGAGAGMMVPPSIGGASGELSMRGAMMAPDGAGGGGATPSNYTKKVQGADLPSPTGFTPLSAPPLGRNEAAGGGFSLGMENVELPETGSTKEGLDSDKALEYAAMAAAIGSLFNAGGPPKPPALSGRGRFDAQPTSMRFLYGGR